MVNFGFKLNIGCENSLIGNMDKDYYFSKDGLGNRQSHYWNKYENEGKLKKNLINREKNATDFII